MPTDVEMKRMKLAEAAAEKEAARPAPVVVEEPIVDIVEPVVEPAPVVVKPPKKTTSKKTTPKKISSYTDTFKEEK